MDNTNDSKRFKTWHWDKENITRFISIRKFYIESFNCTCLRILYLLVFHPDANRLFEVSSNLHQVCDTLYDRQLRYHHNIKIFSHFKPMLLERCHIEDVEKLFHSNKEYFVQIKYDGERSQMHMKDGKYKYFTRQGYDITNNPSYGKTSSSGMFIL